MEPDKSLDLRGKICPMTFVYTKIALEELESGQVLEVILDYPPSFVNVPRSVALQELGTLEEDEQLDDSTRRFVFKKV
jgi:TusA-related sulfurtransferase